MPSTASSRPLFLCERGETAAHFLCLLCCSCCCCCCRRRCQRHDVLMSATCPLPFALRLPHPLSICRSELSLSPHLSLSPFGILANYSSICFCQRFGHLRLNMQSDLPAVSSSSPRCPLAFPICPLPFALAPLCRLPPALIDNEVGFDDYPHHHNEIALKWSWSGFT